MDSNVNECSSDGTCDDLPADFPSGLNTKPLLIGQNSGDEGNDARDKGSKRIKMAYGINDSPPWWESIFLGFQHYMTVFWGSLSVPFLITDNLCIGSDNAVKAELVGSMFFVCGIITIMQVLIGIRLPIVQCSTLALLIPTISYLQIHKHSCPLIRDNCTQAPRNISCVEKNSPEYEELWHSQIQVIQGSIMVASVMEILLGLTGAISLLMKYIGPLTICPTISLIGISLFKATADYGAENWPICLLTFVLLLAFSQYLDFIKIPMPAYSKEKGLHRVKYPLFEMFPVILAILLSWLVCYILTVTNIFPDNPDHWAYGGRTDTNVQFLADTPWFSFFYPGKYGLPRVDMALVLGLCAGLLASIIESVGDYAACARMSGVPAPPNHAINRGIAIEGFGCLLTGAFGTANGSTSASCNICVIGLTKIASRRVVVYAAVIMMVFAVFNKFEAVFVTIPNPIIGASYMVLFGMIIAVGISSLQFVDLNSSRNLFVIGVSFFMGLSISQWIQDHNDAIQTGWAPLDSMILVLLGTSMFVGGLFGFVLDNTIPGTLKERGIIHFDEKHISSQDIREAQLIYGLPFLKKVRRKSNWMKHLPFCPPSDYNQLHTTKELPSKVESVELSDLDETINYS